MKLLLIFTTLMPYLISSAPLPNTITSHNTSPLAGSHLSPVSSEGLSGLAEHVNRIPQPKSRVPISSRSVKSTQNHASQSFPSNWVPQPKPRYPPTSRIVADMTTESDTPELIQVYIHVRPKYFDFNSDTSANEFAAQMAKDHAIDLQPGQVWRFGNRWLMIGAKIPQETIDKLKRSGLGVVAQAKGPDCVEDGPTLTHCPTVTSPVSTVS